MTNTNYPNVVNLHFIDACNYKCVYCFEKKANRVLSLAQCKRVIDNVNSYFKKYGLNGRINLVGGETFVCSYLEDIIDYIHSLGLKASVVTNGSLLTKEFIIRNKNKLETIGLSVDSLVDSTNIKIGRCNNRRKTIARAELEDLCKCIKENGIKLKINHCLSRMNQDEDISDFIKAINPDRFKIFQMTIVNGINHSCRLLQLRNDEFSACCKRYLSLNPVIEFADDMKGSYLMIDADADIYIDKEEAPLGNALKDDFASSITGKAFDIDAFEYRYARA